MGNDYLRGGQKGAGGKITYKREKKTKTKEGKDRDYVLPGKERMRPREKRGKVISRKRGKG